MRKRIFLGMIFSAVAVLVFSPNAFSQAAAESALIHSLSSTTTVHAGTTLGRSLSQSSTTLGARIQQRTSSPLIARPPLGAQKPLVRSRTANNLRVGTTPGASHIAVQGGQSGCAPAATKAQDSSGCQGKPTSSGPDNKYKSFVSLSFPK